MPSINVNDRIVVVDRRLFRDDNTRVFVGTVEEYDGNVVRSRGFVFHISPYEAGGSERRGEERVRVFSLASGDVIYVLPQEIDIMRLVLKRSPKSMTLSDGLYSMDLTDFLLRG